MNVLEEENNNHFWWENILYDADEECDHDVQSASGGGTECTKCKGWFCF